MGQYRRSSRVLRFAEFEPRVLGQRSPEPVHSISIWRPSRQNRPVRPLSIRAHVSKTLRLAGLPQRCLPNFLKSEEHTSELQSLMRISYAVFCLKQKTMTIYDHTQIIQQTIVPT